MVKNNSGVKNTLTVKNSLGFLLADVARLLRSEFQKSLDGSGLTLAQARALLFVARHEGAQQIQLANFLEIQAITLVRLLDHLAKMGLIERQPDASDRRAYLIFLTPAATPYLDTIQKIAAQIHKKVLRGIDAEDLQIAFSVLESVRTQLRDNTH